MSQDDTPDQPPEASLVDTIETTRRRLLSGLGLGAGLAATGTLGSARDWHGNGGGGDYHIHWSRADDHDGETPTAAYPDGSIQTRKEIAGANYDTGYSALPASDRELVTRAFEKQFEGETKHPRIDFSALKPGTAGSMDFGVHIRTQPLYLELKATEWDDLPKKLLSKATATLRHLECPEAVDGTIIEGSLHDVLQALKDGIELDGNRSYGDRGPFDANTSHRFRLEWETPKGIRADGGMFKFGFHATDATKREPTTRKYTVHAIDVQFTYNEFGTNNPEAAMYVLEEDLEAVREAEGETPGTPGIDTSVIEPLVIRANEGDTVEIEFVNSLGQHPERDFEERPASIHPTGVAYEVDDADGKKVGFNENTVVESGESTTYTWHADQQGAYFFQDGAYQAWDSTLGENPERVNSMARGLFGALVVEPPGSTWTDPCTGAPLRSGPRADIHNPDIPDHREFVPVYHDHGIILPDLAVPGTDDFIQTLHGINYRAERTSERIGAIGGPLGSFYSSWVFGDPGGGDNVFEAYQGDPVKFVVVGANHEENHVHHLHEHRWNQIPFDEDSRTRDAQNLGMGTAFEQYLTVASGERSLDPDRTGLEAFAVGAGGDHGSIGDMLFHCHMFPHYGEGMNAFMRVHNKRQLHLQPLANNEPALPFDSDILGFPDFIPGVDGELPPKPPLSQVENPRQPTAEEEASLPALVPGAPYTDPCVDAEPVEPDPATDDIEAAEPDITYEIVAIPARLVYNDHGDYDPDGKIFVLEEDREAVLNGELMPEPLFIRANVGDCIELTVRNELDGDGPTSIHTHFVDFDALASDGFANGFNYDQGTELEETMTYRWFADEEGTIFFHDHVRGIQEIMHGEFAALIVEPEGSEWLDPHTGEPIRQGSQAIINPPEAEAFREFCLMYQDFAPLIDPENDLESQPEDPEDDAFVNPNVQHGVNSGVGAINYRNAPYYRRGSDPDPAYVHSSFVHGDPETPTLETYPDDKVRIRWVHGPYEEQHNFSLHGTRVDDFGDEDAEDTVSQVISSSEAFNFRVRETETHGFDLQNNAANLPIRDYLYGSMVSHDLWDGMWGIHRVFDAEVDHLFPLPGGTVPDGTISRKELREMGHPAAFDNRETDGHIAKLRFDDPQQPPRETPDRHRRRNESIDGNPPPQAPDPGNPCGETNRTVQYDVTALQTQIDFNEYGDHDPDGIVLARDEHVAEIKKGDRPTDPLLLRANVNDCIELTLTNALPKVPDDHDDHPQMRTPEEDLGIQWERSNRISLHANQLIYDVNGSDGATVGFNYDQTVAPGDSITYRWFTEEEVPPAVLWDLADMRSNRHHGAFGMLIIEPEGSQWLDSTTGEPTVSSRQAIITGHDGEDFREFALSMSDARYVINDDGTCVVPADPEDLEADFDTICNQVEDPEDQGYMAFNNRSEPFRRRFEATDPRQELVYDSETHGDPATPVFNAHVGDPVRFRLCQTADASRGISFHLANHRWPRFTESDASPLIGVDAQFSPGRRFTLTPEGGAGGTAGDTGDFIFKEMKERRRLESGSWGIFRVNPLPQTRKKETNGNADRTQVQPLPANTSSLWDRPGWRVAVGDVTQNGQNDVLIGVQNGHVGGYDAGAAYLFYNTNPSEIETLADAHTVFPGTKTTQGVGSRVAIEDGWLTIDSDSRRYMYDVTDTRPTGQTRLEEADRQRKR